jgi:uncharacterized protein (TIGR02271 family)
MDKKSDKRESDNSRFEVERVIPVLEEHVKFGTRRIVKESIVVDKKVIEEEKQIDIPLKTEHYVIERKPMDQYLNSIPETRQEGDTIIIPVVKEVLVKRILLVEEIRLTKVVEEKQHLENITIKKEEVTIERKGPEFNNNH